MFDGIYTTNLSYIPKEYSDKEWLHVVNCSKSLAKIIVALHNGESIKRLVNSKEDLLKVGIETAKEYKDYYTFNDTAENVEISEGSTQNVFIKSAHNVKIGLDCENNLFNSQIRNTTILDGVSDSFVKHSIFQEDIFKVIQNSSINKVVSYIDGDTLTMQTYAIDNIY